MRTKRLLAAAASVAGATLLGLGGAAMAGEAGGGGEVELRIVSYEPTEPTAPAVADRHPCLASGHDPQPGDGAASAADL